MSDNTKAASILDETWSPTVDGTMVDDGRTPEEEAALPREHRIARAKLVALAPRMATAVLRSEWSDWSEIRCCSLCPECRDAESDGHGLVLAENARRKKVSVPCGLGKLCDELRAIEKGAST